MFTKALHSWDLTPHEAIALQSQLAQQISTQDKPGQMIHFVGGIDLAVNRQTGYGRAAVVIMSYPDLAIIETHTHEEPLTWPYIPGLLSFREIPCLLGALAKVVQQPDVLLVDGMGIAHPRRLGIASHLGLFVTIPTIGCGKSLLVGTYRAQDLSEEAWSSVPLIHKKEVIGAVVRTHPRTNPLFISAGNNISLVTALQIVRTCTTKYRLPEPTRIADKLSKFPKSKDL